MSGNTAWMLGGEAPGPQKATLKPKAAPKDVDPLSTHTGTDPYGRAIGPAEDHKEPKKVLNEKGNLVLPPEAKKSRK